MARWIRCLERDAGGAAAVEFALVAPFLIALFMGMVVHGGWLWMAHGAQSLASEAARAAVAGLDPIERETLARAEVEAAAPRTVNLAPERLATAVVQDAERVEVTVTLDLEGHPLITLAGPLPHPPTTIARTAVVRVGGY